MGERGSTVSSREPTLARGDEPGAGLREIGRRLSSRRLRELPARGLGALLGAGAGSGAGASARPDDDAPSEDAAPKTLDEALERARAALETGRAWRRSASADALAEAIRPGAPVPASAPAPASAHIRGPAGALPDAGHGPIPGVDARERAAPDIATSPRVRPGRSRAGQTPGIRLAGPAERTVAMIRAALGDNLFGEPLATETRLETVVTLRLSLMGCFERPGASDPDASESGAPAAEAFEDAAAELEARLRGDPWRFLAARQGRLTLPGSGVHCAHALHLETAVESAPSESAPSESAPRTALAAVARHYDALALRAGFAPALLDLSTTGDVWQARFTAEVPVVVVGVEIGQRSPRIRRDVTALGAPLALASGAALLDEIHDRALDRTALSAEAHADRLAESACGRQALAAAARAEPRQRFIEACGPQAPWLSARGAGRLHDLALRCHPALGRRLFRWLWPAAALGAPLLAAGLALAAALHGDGALRLGRDGALGLAGLVTAAPGPVVAAERAAAAVLIGLLPFAAFWALALGGVAIAFGRRTRRALGFARRLTMADVFARGVGAWAAMATGAGLYGVVFFGLSLGLSLGLSAAPGDGGRSLSPTAAAPPPARAAASFGGQEGARAGAGRDAPEWAVVDGVARTRDATGAVALQLSCAGDAPVLRLTRTAHEQRDADGGLLRPGAHPTPLAGEWAAALIDGAHAHTAAARAVGGGLEWPLSRGFVERLRGGAGLTIDLIDGAGQPTAGLAVSLRGSGAAIDAALAGCRSG